MVLTKHILTFYVPEHLRTEGEFGNYTNFTHISWHQVGAYERAWTTIFVPFLVFLLVVKWCLSQCTIVYHFLCKGVYSCVTYRICVRYILYWINYHGIGSEASIIFPTVFLKFLSATFSNFLLLCSYSENVMAREIMEGN